MKKQHLHKSHKINQRVDEPDEIIEEEVNKKYDKGTYTETEFLDLKPFESSMLYTVMEETIIA